MTTSLKIVWDEHDNLIIRDIDVKWKERILQYLKDKFFENDRLFKIFVATGESNIEEAYLQYFKHILNNECCVIATDESDDKIYGIALVKWMTKEWHSWTDIKHIVNEFSILNKMIHLNDHLLTQYATDNPAEPYDSLHIFDVFIDTEIADINFEAKFFRAICEVARHMKMPRVTVVARTQSEYTRLVAQGFTEILRLIYSMYVIKNVRPFDCLRDNNEMFGTLFEYLVEPLIPYDEMTVREAFVIEDGISMVDFDLPTQQRFSEMI